MASPAAAPQQAAPARPSLRAVFDKFDVDGSGSVSAKEITKMVRNLRLDMTAPQIEQLVKDADPDGSGEICFEEFKYVLQKQLKDMIRKAQMKSACWILMHLTKLDQLP